MGGERQTDRQRNYLIRVPCLPPKVQNSKNNLIEYLIFRNYLYMK